MEGNKRRPRMTAYERALEEFSEHFDLELFALELEYNDELGAAIREAVISRLDARQKTFDKMLARHPATMAENARHAEVRRLEEERLEKIAERRREREERRKCAGVRHLARKWHAKVASVHAS